MLKWFNWGKDLSNLREIKNNEYIKSINLKQSDWY
jgi:hypothetical protein